MTRAELNESIDTTFTSTRADESLTPENEGAVLKEIADYVDQEISALPIGAKTAGNYTLTGTATALPYDVNYVSFSGGIGYLPTTTEIMKEIIVLANANCTIQGNAGNTNSLFVTFGTQVASIAILATETYRFIYIGSGFWKTEKIT